MSFEDEELDHDYPFTFAAETPAPDRFPAAPDELIAHINRYHQGLDRVTVRLFVGRKKFTQLNALKIGASFEETPRASVEQIARGVMAIAQDYFEGVDTTCRFQVQCYVHLRPTGNATRKAAHFELSGGQGAGWDSVEDIADPQRLDEMLMGFVKDLLEDNRKQSTIIQELGEKAIGQMSSMWQAHADALQSQADSREMVMDARREDAADRMKSDKWDKGFQMLEKVLNTGIAQSIVASARAGGASPATKTPIIEVEETPAPKWATRGSNKSSVVDVTATAAAETPSPEPSVADADDAAGKGRALYASITADQWPDLFDMLTKKQVNMLRQLKDETDPATAIRLVTEFKDGLKPAMLLKLATVLGVPQVTAVVELAGMKAGNA